MMRVSVIPTNEEVPCSRWKAWAGKKPPAALLYFDQRSWGQLNDSIPYIVGKGLELRKAKVLPYWNVPFGGAHQMEAVASGSKDSLYRNLFQQILTCYDPASTGKIDVRLPWEFNLATSQGQSLAGENAKGAFDPPLYIAMYRRITGIARAVSPRFRLTWCPNIGKNLAPSPEAFYPGDDVVDVIGLDWYFQVKLNPKDTHAHLLRPASGFGFQWHVDFAKAHKKPAAWCEFGADSDVFAPEIAKALAWAKANGIQWAAWWDRKEVIDTRISDGSLPAIGAVVRSFA